MESEDRSPNDLGFNLENHNEHQPQRRKDKGIKKNSADFSDISSQFENLNIADSTPDNNQEYTSSVSMNNLYKSNHDLWLDNELSLSDDEFSLSINKLSQSHSDISQSDIETSESENYEDAVAVLTCPDCGDVVELFNENCEFSLQLHSQKHKDLNSINSEEIEYNPNIDYICPICHLTIPIFNKNIELSVSCHFEERKFDHEGLGFASENMGARPDLTTNAFDKLPEDMRKYQQFIVMKEGKFFCLLCKCTLQSLGSHDLLDSICEHVSSKYHAEQYRSSCQYLAKVVVDYNKQNQGDQEQLDLFEEIVRKHPVVKNNRKFIEKRTVHYFCTICQKHINYSPNETMLTLNFVLHFKGKCHEKALKPMMSREVLQKEGSATKVKKESGKKSKRLIKSRLFLLSLKCTGVNLNLKYIKIKNGKLSCKVCSQSVQFIGSHLTSHFRSKTHNERLSESFLFFKSRLIEQGKLKTNIDKYSGPLRNAFNELSNDEFFKPHTSCIIMDKKGCRCFLCNVVLSPSKQCIKKHFLDAVHKKNAFSINQQMKSLTNQSGISQNKGPSVSVMGKNQPTSNSKNKNVMRENVHAECDKKLKKKLQYLLIHSDLVKINYICLEIRNGMFFCNVCCETIRSTGSGKHLLTHLKSKEHKNLKR